MTISRTIHINRASELAKCAAPMPSRRRAARMLNVKLYDLKWMVWQCDATTWYGNVTYRKEML